MNKCCPVYAGTLFLAKINVVYKVTAIKNSMPCNLQRRIMELGFLQNKEVILVKKSVKSKALLVQTSIGFFCLRSDIAKQIFVEEV